MPTPTANDQSVLRKDVQGIILRGYEPLEEARFLLLNFPDAPAAAGRYQGWLQGIVPLVRDATVRPTGDDTAVNIAFTTAGLTALGLKELAPKDSSGFAREFLEGMDTPPLPDNAPTHRQRILGDLGSSAPVNWDWGRYNDPQPIHAMLMLYAGVPAVLETLYEFHRSRLEQSGIAVVRRLDTTDLVGRKEQFGFRDGIGQPDVLGVEKDATDAPANPSNQVTPGEILLGFANAYGKRPVSPAAAAQNGNGKVNFGYCGSYLVFRQVRQQVWNFWHFLYDKATGSSDAERLDACVALAAKMVGRWPSGCPLALSPERDNPALMDSDDFGYQEADSLGVEVPIGCHIRRSNPRDSLEPGPTGKGRLAPDESRRVTLLHRMIRRGRPYGPPVHLSMKPADILASPAPAANEDRGLHFLCFNASIARQFEFVQQTWVNNPKFGGLYGDNDPLMGQRRPDQGLTADTFTAQGTPVRRRVLSLPEFVVVRGGAYFFMPGMEALKYLAGLPDKLPAPTAEELGEAEDAP